MTPGLSPSSVVGVDSRSVPLRERPAALVDLAASWLSSEAASVGEPGRIELVGIAGERATAYEEALALATLDEVRRAWEQAVVRQARNDVGSPAWATALRVAELLRFEYAAIRERLAGSVATGDTDAARDEPS